MSLEYIRQQYNVPAFRGQRVEIYDGREGTVTSSLGRYLRVRVDGDRSILLDPTWHITYLDGPKK